MRLLRDRRDAGQRLAEKLHEYKKSANTLALGLLRGGIVVAHEIAQELQLSFDGIVVRKIGAPINPELAVGALAPENTLILDQEILSLLHLSQKDIEPLIQEKKQELLQREKLYRHNRPYLLENKTIILVDDGVATGLTMQAAISFVKKHNPTKIIVAVPVLPPETFTKLSSLVDQVVYLAFFDEYTYGISQTYLSFPELSDHEVIELLSQAT